MHGRRDADHRRLAGPCRAFSTGWPDCRRSRCISRWPCRRDRERLSATARGHRRRLRQLSRRARQRHDRRRLPRDVGRQSRRRDADVRRRAKIRRRANREAMVRQQGRRRRRRIEARGVVQALWDVRALPQPVHSRRPRPRAALRRGVPAAVDQSMVVMGVASGIWYAIISFLAFRVGSNWADLQKAIGRYGKISAAVALIIVLVGVASG